MHLPILLNTVRPINAVWVSSEPITAPAKLKQHLGDAMAPAYHITAPASHRFAEGQSTTHLHNCAWASPATPNDTVLCHKERVMCFQYTHICLRQYVCLRPHPTTIFINKYNNTIISLIFSLSLKYPITAWWWCLITRVIYCLLPPSYPKTSLV